MNIFLPSLFTIGFVQAKDMYASARDLSGNETLQLSFLYQREVVQDTTTSGKLAERDGYRSNQHQCWNVLQSWVGFRRLLAGDSTPALAGGRL